MSLERKEDNSPLAQHTKAAVQGVLREHRENDLATKVEKACKEIMKRDECTRQEAMQAFREQHPELYAQWQNLPQP